MRRNNPVEHPSRQSPLAILMLILQFARNILRQFWPVALLLLINRQRSEEFGFLLGFLALSFFSMAGSILSWFRFYYWLDDRHLMVHKGILTKQKLQIPFERIQAIKLEQNIFQQMMNIAKVEIETAGAKGSEITIHALPVGLAHQIRAYVLDKKADLDAESQAVEKIKGGVEVSAGVEGKPLFQLSIGTMVKIGLSQNHLRTVLWVVFFIYFPLDNQLGSFFGMDREGENETLWDNWSQWLGLFSVVMFGLILLILSVGYSIGQVIFRYADFIVYKTREGLRVVGGLLNRTEQVVVQRKIQLMLFDSNPIRRLLGLQRVRFFQASGESVSLNESIMVPGCTSLQADKLLQEYLDPALLKELTFKRVQPLFAWRHFLISLFLPFSALTAVAIFRFGTEAAWLFMLLPLLAVFAWIYYRNLQYAVSSEFIVVKRGVFYKTITLLKLHKIQAVTLYRGFYELRKGDLGTVILHSAARKVSVPFLTLKEAGLLVDYITKKVETDRRSWI
jgi:putative membrane protein